MQCFLNKQTNNENETKKIVINFFCCCFFCIKFLHLVFLYVARWSFNWLYPNILNQVLNNQKYHNLFICVLFVSAYKMIPLSNQQLVFHCRQIWSIYIQFNLRFISKLKVCGLEIELKCNWLNQHSIMVSKFKLKKDG